MLILGFDNFNVDNPSDLQYDENIAHLKTVVHII